jgi:hypothetical protein
MQETLIAPCGMNCALCVSYQFMNLDLNKEGFNRRYCPGCIPRGKHCTFMSKHCKTLKEGLLRFCFMCEKFPCARLKALDKRYRDKYKMSMIENLTFIQNHTVHEFLKSQYDTWQCSRCGELTCCHLDLCLSCEIDKLKQKRK